MKRLEGMAIQFLEITEIATVEKGERKGGGRWGGEVEVEKRGRWGEVRMKLR